MTPHFDIWDLIVTVFILLMSRCAYQMGQQSVQPIQKEDS